VTLKQQIAQVEQAIIRNAIANHGSRVAAARVLGITTQTLRNKLRAKPQTK
jgi:transcriptional regulator with PAS, ATPase and Fis domain